MEKLFKKPIVICVMALICCALWGSAFPCVKIGYELLQIKTTGSQILFAGYRFVGAGILTVLMGCIIEKRVLTLKKSAIPYVAGIGIFQTTLQYIFFYIGMANTTGVKGSVINASNAFVSIIVAHFLVKGERMTWKKGVGCILGFAGVVIINLSPGAWGSGFSLKGEGMVAICTIIYGTSSVLMKFVSKKGRAMAITAYQLMVGGAALIGFGFLLDGNISGFTVKSSLLLFYMAMLSAVAFSLWTTLLKYNPVGKVTIYGFSIPIFGAGLSAVFLGEDIFSLKNLVALLCVSAGIILVNKVSAGERIVANEKEMK